ncbi:MAG: molybdopterin molybdotransferase MoeA, partial [Gammaproteobacteria bacterium]|nr:molybdopterin molybdotransferase MoeA [Gammaproteobacteria bacterium]
MTRKKSATAAAAQPSTTVDKRTATVETRAGYSAPATAAAAADVCDTDPAAVTAERAQQLIDDAVTPLAEVETVATRAALGRVAAADVISGAPVPNHTNAAMDGYALAARDLPARGGKKFRVVGVSMAGKPYQNGGGKLGPGQCVRIMTGAVMPAGADSVVAQERVARDGDHITVQGGESPRGNVRQAGEDFAAGAVAITAGRRLAAAHLGLAASLGFAELRVFRRPRVAFFSTGDELRALGTPLREGELYDSNRYTLYGMLSELGVDLLDFGIVADDAEAVRAAFLRGAECADVVVTSAGASVGDADFVRQTLAAIGRAAFTKVAIKPGRPLAFGAFHAPPNRLFFALPGNPVSVMVTFQIFVAPALRKLAGEAASAPLRLRATTVSALKKRPGRAEYQRGILFADAGGALTVRSTGQQGSGILRSMGEANCFIVLPTDSPGAAAGDEV